MTKNDYKTIGKIADRAMVLYKSYGITLDRMSLLMDLEFTNEVNPMRLDELLAADNGNFGHDISGILKHFNRRTKVLDDGFSPRYSA
jgi:hypothetical protein